MKILTVVYNLEKGGTQRSAQAFAEAYHELNHDSRIVSLYGLGPRYSELEGVIPVWDGINSDNLHQIKEWDPNIVHLHSHGPKKNEIDKILTSSVHATIIETNVFSKPSPWADKVDISYQLSTWALWLFNLRGGHKYNSAIVPNPIKCDSFQKSSIQDVTAFRKQNNIPKNAFVMGRIGQSYDGKWSPLLIDIFNELSSSIPNLFLLIINAPNTILDKAAQSAYHKNIVHIPKIIGDDNLAIAYSSMDLMLHIATQGESFGMVLTESILCETPVVALSTPWADNSQGEVIGNGKGGVVVHSKQGIKNAVRKIYTDSKENFSVSGLKHIEQHFDYIKVAKKALDLSKTKRKDKFQSNLSEVLRLLDDSYDGPNLLTRLFLCMQTDRLRRLTIYTSSYKNIYKSVWKLIWK